MNKFIIFNISLLWIFLNLFIGFIVFLILIKDNYSKEVIIDPISKFIVVATGGSNRILEGINIFKKYNNMKMLITGVGEGITKSDIAKAISAGKKQIMYLECCVDLGSSAVNTRGNAKEASLWLKKNNSNNSFLVTANYHMPRLINEFKRVDPNFVFNIIPVKPKLDPIKDIYFPGNFIIVFREYLKFLISKSNLWYYKVKN